MLVKKNVFNFQELNCSLEDAAADCCKHFFKLVHNVIYECQDTRGLLDKERVLEESKVISFDTNCIKMEFTQSLEQILLVDLGFVKHLDKDAENECVKEFENSYNPPGCHAGYVTFKGHIQNILEYTSPDGTSKESKGPTDYTNWSYKIYIKVIDIGNRLYYFYTI